MPLPAIAALIARGAVVAGRLAALVGEGVGAAASTIGTGAMEAGKVVAGSLRAAPQIVRPIFPGKGMAAAGEAVASSSPGRMAVSPAVQKAAVETVRPATQTAAQSASRKDLFGPLANLGKTPGTATTTALERPAVGDVPKTRWKGAPSPAGGHSLDAAQVAELPAKTGLKPEQLAARHGIQSAGQAAAASSPGQTAAKQAVQSASQTVKRTGWFRPGATNGPVGSPGNPVKSQVVGSPRPPTQPAGVNPFAQAAPQQPPKFRPAQGSPGIRMQNRPATPQAPAPVQQPRPAAPQPPAPPQQSRQAAPQPSTPLAQTRPAAPQPSMATPPASTAAQQAGNAAATQGQQQANFQSAGQKAQGAGARWAQRGADLYRQTRHDEKRETQRQQVEMNKEAGAAMAAFKKGDFQAIEHAMKAGAIGMKLFGKAIGVATGGIVGAVGFAAAVAMLPKSLRDWSSALLESRRNLAELNGQYAVTFARLDVQRLGRNFRFAQATSGSSAGLAQSLSRLESRLLPYASALTNGMNMLANHIINRLDMGIKILEFGMHPMLKMILAELANGDGESQSTPLAQFALQVKNGQPWGRDVPKRHRPPPR